MSTAGLQVSLPATVLGMISVGVAKPWLIIVLDKQVALPPTVFPPNSVVLLATNTSPVMSFCSKSSQLLVSDLEFIICTEPSTVLVVHCLVGNTGSASSESANARKLLNVASVKTTSPIMPLSQIVAVPGIVP